jgi:hypothetical protein
MKTKIIKSNVLGFELNVIIDSECDIISAFTDEGGTYPLLEHERFKLYFSLCEIFK